MAQPRAHVRARARGRRRATASRTARRSRSGCSRRCGSRGSRRDAVEAILRPEPVEADLDTAWAALKRDKKGEGVFVLLEAPGKPVVTDGRATPTPAPRSPRSSANRRAASAVPIDRVVSTRAWWPERSPAPRSQPGCPPVDSPGAGRRPERGQSRRPRRPRPGALRRPQPRRARDARSTAGRRELGCTARCFQTNHEGQFVEWCHDARGWAAGLIVNPGAWSHYSYAIRDALELCSRAGRRGAPFEHRGARGMAPALRRSRTSSSHRIIGKGPEGYHEALAYVKEQT